MTELVDFLRARLDEDERESRDALDPNTFDLADMLPIGCWDEHRVLAEVEAKRRILDLWSEARREDAMGADYPVKQFFAGRLSIIEAALRALALPYADHPDYDESWRP